MDFVRALTQTHSHCRLKRNLMHIWSRSLTGKPFTPDTERSAWAFIHLTTLIHICANSAPYRTHTWHGCQLSPSSPEVINHLFTVSFQTTIEDCSKPLCLSLKPLSSFIITLVTCVTAIMCVFMFGRCSFGFFLLHMIVHNYISQLTVTFTPIKVNLSMF